MTPSRLCRRCLALGLLASMLIHGMVFYLASHLGPVPITATAIDLDLSLFVDSSSTQPVTSPKPEVVMGEGGPLSEAPVSRPPQPKMPAPIVTPASSTRPQPHPSKPKSAIHKKPQLNPQIKTVRTEFRPREKPENTTNTHPNRRQPNNQETLKPPATRPFADYRPSRDAAKVDSPTAPKSQDISRHQDEHDLFGLGFRASNATNPKIDSQLRVDQKSVTGIKGPTSSVGQTRAGGSPGVSAASRVSAERAYLAELQRAIGRYQRFPEEARRNHRAGVVVISFVILADGRLQQAAIAQSSGFSDLDQAALAALSRLSRFKPIPSEIGRGHWAIRVPIRFDLR